MDIKINETTKLAEFIIEPISMYHFKTVDMEKLW